MRIVRGFSVLFVVGFFAACNAIIGNESDYRLVPSEAGAGCTDNDECGSGQVCLFGACSDECTGDVDCNTGSRCIRTLSGTGCAVHAATACSSRSCPEGTVCKGGSCRDECEGKADCLGAQECADGICVGTDPRRDPAAVNRGSGGAPGSGGTVASGGRPSSGGSVASGGTEPVDSGDGGAPGSGGTVASGGSPGSGGATTCTPSGPENCYNDVDDDCNGKLDCEDPACTTPATCVAQSIDGVLGTWIASGPCPQGYEAFPLMSELNAPLECDGCSCTPSGDARCETGAYAHGPYPCPSYQFSGPLVNVFSDRCNGIPADTNLHYYSVRQFTTCNPVGTPVLKPASWGSSGVFCRVDKTGGGCGPEGRCVPKANVATRCSMVAGDQTCGGKYSRAVGDVWYERVQDTRECTQCQCGFGIAPCTGGYLQVYSGGGCTGTAYNVGQGAEGDACGLPFVPASSRVIGTVVNPSCPPNNFATGEATPQNPHTVCCQ